MKSRLLAVALAGTMAQSVFAADPVLETDIDKESYGIGMLIGQNLTDRFGDLNYELLLEGLKAQKNGATVLTLEEAQNMSRQHQIRIAEEKSAEAKAAGEKFLADNAARDEVEVTDTGLQYEVIAAGDGAKPSVDDTVTVHYTGTLIDGRVFDSSVERGEPATFNLKGVIPGWTEGLQLMNTGSKFRFVIPANLAYGDRGAGQNIGPGETLIFDVELLEIQAQ